MKYRLYNKTIGKWVRSDDGIILECDTREEADIALDAVNDLKQLNPEHKNDEIVIKEHEQD